jgi:hypothetical protein
MRPALLATTLLLAALGLAPGPAAAAGAGEPQLVTLKVGERRAIGGFGGICDDLKVATITLDTNATITAVGPGRTLCSSRVGGSGGGIRKVYRVVVE